MMAPTARREVGGDARQQKQEKQQKQENKAIANPIALPTLLYRVPIPTDGCASAIWIVQRLNHYAVKRTVELRFLAVFQHVVDPTRVCTVADKNSAVTQLDLRPTVSD